MKAPVLLHHTLAAGKKWAAVPMVFLHGLFGSYNNLWDVAKTVQKDVHNGEHTVVAADLRNHGRSPHRDSMSLDDQVDDLKYTLTDLFEGRPVALMGHSLGGKVAMLFALRYPEMVRSMVIEDVAPVTYTDWVDIPHFVKALQSLQVETLDSRKAADEQLKTMIPSPAIRQFLLTNIQADLTGKTKYRWRCNLPVIAENLDHIRGFPSLTTLFDERGLMASALGERCLFVRGEHSKHYLPERDQSTVDSMFPASKMHVISRAGHWVHAEQRDAFVEVVTEHFTSTLQP